MKVQEVRSAMRLWQMAARKYGPASEQAKRTFLDYRFLASKFTAETNVRLTGYLLGPIEYAAQPEWVSQANKES